MKAVRSMNEAAKLIQPTAVYRPHEELKEVYDKNYEVFKRLHRSNAKNFAMLNS
jgi:xylulokinase